MRIIAEVGNAHEGSLLEAEAYIRACAEIGCWGVKFQRREPIWDPVQGFRRALHHPQDKTRADYWRRVSFSDEEWEHLIELAAKEGIRIGISIFHYLSAEWAWKKGFDFFKVPAIVSRDKRIAKALEPRARGWMRPHFVSFTHGPLPTAYMSHLFTVLGCSPRHPERCWNVMWMDHAPYVKGFSSHCPDTDAAKMVFKAGYEWFETHVCWSRRQRVPDVQWSLTIDELAGVVRATY